MPKCASVPGDAESANVRPLDEAARHVAVAQYAKGRGGTRYAILDVRCVCPGGE